MFFNPCAKRHMFYNRDASNLQTIQEDFHSTLYRFSEEEIHTPHRFCPLGIYTTFHASVFAICRYPCTRACRVQGAIAWCFPLDGQQNRNSAISCVGFSNLTISIRVQLAIQPASQPTSGHATSWTITLFHAAVLTIFWAYPCTRASKQTNTEWKLIYHKNIGAKVASAKVAKSLTYVFFRETESTKSQQEDTAKIDIENINSSLTEQHQNAFFHAPAVFVFYVRVFFFFLWPICQHQYQELQ